MSNLLSIFNSSLPDEVTFDFDQFQTGNANFGKDSYFDVEVTDNGLLSGQYDAYCIDTDRGIPNSGTITAKVFSTYETLPGDLVGDQSTLPGAPAGFGNIENPENFDLLNWILNQCFVGKELSDSNGNSLGTVTYGDVQRAIWELIDNENSTVGLGPFSQDRADLIKELAETNGEDFVPSFEYTTIFGEQVTGQAGVILIPDSDGFEDDTNDTNPFDSQFLIIGVELAKLGDFVWDDLNANGILDDGEEGIEGATVNLLSDIDGDGEIEDDEIVDTTTTDADGNYEFEVVAGDYKVEFETPDGFDMASPANQGSDDTKDSDGPISDEINLEAGENNSTIDAGFFKKASLGDQVFFDDDGDGIQDPGEAGVSGVTVTLTGGGADGVIGTADDTTETTTTNGNGEYEFTGLNPGEEYKVTFEESTLPDGFEFTDANVGGDDTVDSDADPTNGMTQVVTLESGENNTTIDAGIVETPTGSIGDTIFRDNNGDGDQDPGEAGISGVEVRLTDKGPDGVFGTADDVVIGTETTDANGEYLFEDLDAGNYQVEVLNDNGALDGLDQTADPDGTLDNGSMVELDPGENDLDQDFGYDEPDPQNPDIEIEKSTNGVDADEPDEAPEIDPGETVTWTYEVTNTGDVSFAQSEVVVTDDIEGIISNIIDKGDGDNTLAPGEIWIYEQTGIAQDLSTVTNTVIDFETDGLGNSLPAGTIIDDEYQNLGVTISATQFGAMIFDSANPTGGDGDLATDSEGNILIISEDGDSSDPDDNARGGVITFDLDNPVDVNSINFVDIEENGGKVFTTDADGNITTTSIPAPGNNSLQTLNINDNDVVKIEVDLVGSGAISGVDFDSITEGIYKNIGTVVADDVTDSDPSHYVNGEPDPQNPGIDIEKFTNGVNADTVEEAPEIAPHETVTWTYEVTNTGNVPFDKSDIEVTDDQEGTITHISDKGDGDNTLAPGETWIYQETGTAQDLMTVTEGTTETFNFTGNSGLDGPNGNVRTFNAGDLSVNASAFSRDQHGNWDESFLGSFSSGLGVTDNSEGKGKNKLHKVDNVGEKNYVLFEFSDEVVVDKTFLASVTNDSDITYWVGNKEDAFTDHNILSDNFLNSLEFTEDNNTWSSSSRWADINGGEVSGNVLVIAASTSDNTPEDRFKIKKLGVESVETVGSGFYQNLGTVDINGLTDEDLSHYVNPDFSV